MTRPVRAPDVGDRVQPRQILAHTSLPNSLPRPQGELGFRLWPRRDYRSSLPTACCSLSEPSFRAPTSMEEYLWALCFTPKVRIPRRKVRPIRSSAAYNWRRICVRLSISRIVPATPPPSPDPTTSPKPPVVLLPLSASPEPPLLPPRPFAPQPTQSQSPDDLVLPHHSGPVTDRLHLLPGPLIPLTAARKFEPP